MTFRRTLLPLSFVSSFLVAGCAALPNVADDIACPADSSCTVIQPDGLKNFLDAAA